MTFGLAMSKKLKVGQYIGVGDQFSVTSDTYLRFDDTDAQKVIAFKSSYSGTYERPLGVYTLTQAGEYSGTQYPFTVSGASSSNTGFDIAITSEQLGTAPEGFYITAGAGTQSDPYVLGLSYSSQAIWNAEFAPDNEISYGTDNIFSTSRSSATAVTALYSPTSVHFRSKGTASQEASRPEGYCWVGTKLIAPEGVLDIQK